MNAYLCLVPQQQGRRVLVGAFDLNIKTRQFDAIKPITVGIARILLKGGSDAINAARDIAKETLTKPALPGATDRDNVYWKLDYYTKDLAKQSDVNMIYGSADDLRKWVLQAFIEYNAAEEGRQSSEALADKRWNEMIAATAEALAHLPTTLAKTAGQAVAELRKIPGAFIESATGVPAWMWGVGGVALIGVLGFAAYKIAVAAAPAVATHYLARR